MIWVMKATLYFRGHGSSLDITDTPTINKIIVRPRKKTFPAVPTLHYFVHLKKKIMYQTSASLYLRYHLFQQWFFSRCIFLVLVCLSEKIPECLRATWRIVGIWGISDASNRMRLHFGAHTHTHCITTLLSTWPDNRRRESSFLRTHTTPFLPFWYLWKVNIS